MCRGNASRKSAGCQCRLVFFVGAVCNIPNLSFINQTSEIAMKCNVLKPLLGVGFLLVLGILDAQAAGDSEQGQKKFYTCAGCHGIPGYSNSYPAYHVPRIGGQHPEYVISALKAYQSAQRKHTSMHANATTLTQDDMEDIATYVARFRNNAATLPVRGDAGSGGEKAGLCAGCHGEDGNSEDPGYPKLAGQYESYLVKALTEYRSGSRKNAIMAGFAAGLTDQDILDVSAYYASQKRGLATVGKE
jgi:cytochrome c553